MAKRSAEQAQAPEMPESKGSEGSPERAESSPELLKAGDNVEATRLDGSRTTDTYVGPVKLEDFSYDVFARTGSDDDTILRIMDQNERHTRQEAAKTHGVYADVHQAGVDSTVKAMGLKGADADEVRDRLAASESANIAAAMGTKDPEKALLSSVQDQAKSNEPSVVVNLVQLEMDRGSLARKADEAYRSGNEKAYNMLTQQMYAVEKAILEARLAQNPNAGKAEKAQIADDVEGFVKPLPDSLYDKGLGAVHERIAELEKQMDVAEKARDGVAFLAAEDERKRHRVMLPILEAADGIQKAEDEITALKAQSEAAQKAEIKAERSRVRAGRSYWRKISDGLQSLLRRTGEEMEELEEAATKSPMRSQQKGAGAKYLELEAARKEKMIKLAQIQTRVEGLNSANEALKAQKIEVTFDDHEKINGAQTGLYRKLRDTYRSNPDQVMEYVNRAVKDEEVSESTREILDLFQHDVKEGTIEDEAPVSAKAESPKADAAPKAAEPQDPLHGMTYDTFFDPKPTQPMSPLERGMKDLRDAGYVTEGGDLKALEIQYNELAAKLAKNGHKPSDEGLPNSFQEIVNAKDERGFFGKLFKKQTKRVELMDRLGVLHYQYIAAGHVEMAPYLARQRENQDKFNEGMKNAGRF